MDIYANDLYLNATSPEQLGRTDWHHNEYGQVDYIPTGKGAQSYGNEIPLEEQKYNYEYEANREEAATNLAIVRGYQPDWREYERIMRDYN